METYYARHTRIALSDSEIASLRKRNRIAIHYPEAKGRPIPEFPDATSLDPNHYGQGAKRALNALHRLAAQGGYVVAHYRNAGELVVGKVAPASEIALERSTWHTEYPGREAVLKTLAYEERMVLRLAQQRRALVPPRQSTLTVWRAVGDRIRKLVEGEAIAPDLSGLESFEQEVLCGEFLREPTIAGVPRLSALLMPIGRQMRYVDIYGFADDGKPLYAQVKYDHDERYARELESLYGMDECHLLLFSGDDRLDLSGRVLRLPLAEIYRQYCATRQGAVWLKFISKSI